MRWVSFALLTGCGGAVWLEGERPDRQVVEKALPMLSFASGQGNELSFSMKLAGHCKGVATCSIGSGKK